MLNLIGSSKSRTRAGLIAGGLVGLSVGSSLLWNDLSQPVTVDSTDSVTDTSSAYSSAWQHVSANFALDHDLNNPRVKYWIRWYQHHPTMFNDYASNAKEWLPYVIRQVEERNLPGEIALLPFIESGYSPYARSPTGPLGIWQLSATTASEIGLSNRLGYAARQDVTAATPAALNYLESLRERYFPNSWELTLASYNAGPGRILEAQLARHTKDYWSLSLSKETMNYVPKLMALSAIIANPKRYGITLPHLDDKTTFSKVDFKHSLNLRTAAKLAGINETQLKALNPGYVGQWASESLLIPHSSVSQFKDQLEKYLDNDSALHYVVAEGDTLSGISYHSGIPVKSIRQTNQLTDNTPLQVGQTLLLENAS